MIALSTLSILTLIPCFNLLLFGSLGLYLLRHRGAPTALR